MKKGDLVQIYQDPKTQQKPEGEAKLVKRVPCYDEGMERWEVRFPGDGGAVTRVIKVS